MVYVSREPTRVFSCGLCLCHRSSLVLPVERLIGLYLQSNVNTVSMFLYVFH